MIDPQISVTMISFGFMVGLDRNTPVKREHGRLDKIIIWVILSGLCVIFGWFVLPLLLGEYFYNKVNGDGVKP
ncbi:MAG TPA: hypothetical protein ENH90_01890 [bacterium]|nr:hypothetical protein [bacterium]